MTEPRRSGRADGRGWGGRGDAGRRQRAGRPQSSGPSHPGEERLRGPGDSPWVRFEPPESQGQGFERPPGRGHGETSAHRSQPPLPDLSTLLVVLDGLRAMVPREVSAQFNALVRELLLTLRALIDWYLEHLDGEEREPEVEDIPID